MQIDLELYRRNVRVSLNPPVSLSVIDIAPAYPDRIVVFLHGFGGDATQWRYQLEKFALSSRVIAPDLRGHGQSDKPSSGYHMERILDDVVASLDVLGVAGKATLVGHSFGGAIAVEFAVRYPERVDHLVLLATAGEFRLNTAYRTALQLPSTVLRRFRGVTSSWLGAPPDILRAWYHTNLTNWRGWPLFEKITAPTLVIRGHKDLVFEKQYFDGVIQAIPGADEVNVGHSGHMVMIERRDAVNREIDRFLSVTPRTWRYEPEDNPQDQLVLSRPWLNHYQHGVPFTVGIPPAVLPDLLDSAVRRFPHRKALDFMGRSMTYKELNNRVNRVANALQLLGLEQGQRVLILLPNLSALIETFYGTLRAGGVVVFFPPDMQKEVIQEQIAKVEVSFAILTTQETQILEALQESPYLRHIVLVNSEQTYSITKTAFGADPHAQDHKWLGKLMPSGRILRYQDLLAFSPSFHEAEVHPRDLAVISFTGGTTASPKGVMLSHRNLVANTIQVRHWMPEAQEGKEIFLCVVTLTHSYGLTTALNVPISLGATLILKQKFEVENILQTIKKLHPSVFPGVPAMFLQIINAANVRSFGISSIKFCISGSAPLPVEIHEAFERLTKATLVEGYGLTEAGPVTHANPLRGNNLVGSIGLPLPSTEAKIVDLTKTDRSAPVGQIGELAVRGPQVMLGYWQDQEKTAEALTRDGWLLTGDVAQMDPSGYFHLIARKADMWLPGRTNKPAFPRDIEEVIYEIPQVREVAVIPIANQPIAFVITGKDRPEKETILSYCRRRLPPELIPRLIFFVDDFPRTFIGKVRRQELAKRFRDMDNRDH